MSLSTREQGLGLRHIDHSQIRLEILPSHVEWLQSQNYAGRRAILSYCNLRNIDLRGHNLRTVDMTGSDLSGQIYGTPT